MKTITVLREVLSDAVSPGDWVEKHRLIHGSDGSNVCLLTGTPERQKNNGSLILLSPKLAQFALDMYPHLAKQQLSEPKNLAVREAFEQCGELIVALEPLVQSVPNLDDAEEEAEPVRSCRVCGCTDADCRQCIAKTGKPCTWVGADLCSACTEEWMA